MATKANLMGLGVNAFQAQRFATDPTLVFASGASTASATAIGGSQYLTVVTTTSAAGSGIALPQVGTDNGALLGDDFIINNQVASSITVFGPAGTTLSIAGVNNSLSTGVGLSTHKSITAYPITTSSWMGITS